MKDEMTGKTVFRNTDDRLREQALRVQEERAEAGLDGLVGGLACIIVTAEPDRHVGAVEELLRYTGYDVCHAYEDAAARTACLSCSGSADILVQSRKDGDNPFASFNQSPGSAHLPNTRLETFVFETPDLDRYVDIQRGRGVRFLMERPEERPNCRFIQTEPSRFTHNSIGLIGWKGERHRYDTESATPVDLGVVKPDAAHLRAIGLLDHAATRLTARDRDPAILEFMALTNYDFAFALYVPELNSITNVARRGAEDFALVFTSGIAAEDGSDGDGPTERFVRKYGMRTHHLAFVTDDIRDTFGRLREDGLDFLSELVGSEEQGIIQTFSAASPNTLLVNEYIKRFGEFDGFFTQNNVAMLTEATAKQ